MQRKTIANGSCFKQLSRIGAFCLLVALLLPAAASALPTSAEQVRRVVQYWLFQDQNPLDTRLGTEIKDIVAYNDDQGEPLYYAVSLEPTGFVIVAGDDRVEPIIAFGPGGEFDPSSDNPLGALVGQDVPQRVAAVRSSVAIVQKSALTSDALSTAQQKWEQLDRFVLDNVVQDHLPGDPDDIRVVPFIESHWNQDYEASGQQCYNLYTPNNWPAGCTATAVGMLMKHYEYPTDDIGTAEFDVYVDNHKRVTALSGGDGNGGPYNWHLMDDGPFIDDLPNKQAIARLFHDTGAIAEAKYHSRSTGGSVYKSANRLVSVFGYSNAIVSQEGMIGDLPAANRDIMINTNVDAELPVILSVYREKGIDPDTEFMDYSGHAVIADGYGYNNNTMYHHLNMGWGTSGDAWYDLPDIDKAEDRHYTILNGIMYNVYTPDGDANTSETGEIISGRVTYPNGAAMGNVEVTLVAGGGAARQVSTNGNGIYAFTKVPSETRCTVSAAKAGRAFGDSQVLVTGLSETYSNTSGNIWGINFVGTDAVIFPPTVETVGVTNIGTTSATGLGNIISIGSSELNEYGVCWRLTENPTLSDSCARYFVPREPGEFGIHMPGELVAGTTYYLRAYAANDVGVAYGRNVSFTTVSYTPPSVSTNSVSDILNITATGNGDLTSLGIPASVTDYGICWDTNNEPDLGDHCYSKGSKDKIGLFEGPMTGLVPLETYYVRAYAVNEAGTAYGGERSFTTTDTSEEIVTGDVSNIHATYALGGGYMEIPVGDTMLQHGVCWSKSPLPTIDNSIDCSNEGKATSTTAFTSDITGLNSGITYYVRAYADNDTAVAYGNEVSFRTATYPAVTTRLAHVALDNRVLLGGEIDSLGSPKPFSHGFCWSTSPNPTTGDNKLDLGPVSSAYYFSTVLTELEPDTTYYMRAWVENNAGKRYGAEEFSFTTYDRALAIEKTITSGGLYTAVGDIISYSYLVSNSGNVRLRAPVKVADDKISMVGCPSVSTVGNNDSYFDPSETITCSASYTVVQADIVETKVRNSAYAYADGVTSATVDATAYGVEANPALTLDTTILSGEFYTAVGDMIHYRYEITNSGNVKLTDPVNIDNVRSNFSVTCSTTYAVGNANEYLDPAETIVCTASYTVVQANLNHDTIVDVAHATAITVSGDKISSNTDTVTSLRREVLTFPWSIFVPVIILPGVE